MSAILQVGNQKIAAEQFVSLLKSSQLLPQLLREFFIEQAIAPIEYSSEELEGYCNKIAQQPENYGTPSQHIQLRAPRQLKLEKFKESTWGDRVESTFLNCQEQLDRVLFSLIQSEDVEVIQELYFRLQEGEESFAKLASQYSQGPEAHTNGLVGPIELNNLHPKLAQVLKVSQPGQLSPPIRVDKWLVIVRLERYIPAQFDGKMRQRLLDELFEAWLQENISKHAGTVNLQDSDDLDLPPLPLKDDFSATEETAEFMAEAEIEETPELPGEEKESVRALPSKNRGISRNQIAAALLLCLVPFGLGIATVEGLARWKGRSESNSIALNPRIKSLSATVAPKVPDEEAFRSAVNKAMSAAVLTQNAQSQAEWQLVADNWQTAIALMKRVPSSHKDYAVAREKVGEYQKNLDYAQSKLGTSIDAFREAVNNAMRAAELTQTAKSPEDWNTVATHWQKAIAFMGAVPSNNSNYEVAREKVDEYQKNLSYAKSKTDRG
ncbi:peptidylprolyl isomerase [Lusitaniella coriacea]|uniref:peptidylprolyl isomerase n=1 Tax=Lusitaniella coriacea TaxID=1983105 RepID=UPI003CEEA008